jgi:hypothetical protein
MRSSLVGTRLTFEKSSLWRRAFAVAPGGRGQVSAFYASHLRDLREKARVLVDRVRVDVPYLTVHDITHLDALWEIASTIAGSTYRISPAEGYVLGASILLHDAAMCLAAFPGGMEEIRKTSEWKDTIVMLRSDPEGANDDVDDENNDVPKELVRLALPIVLRLLHAKQAEQLPRMKWVNSGGDAEYLIENSELRAFYGPVIGKISRSHGESIGWVRSEFHAPLGALASHDGGEVNALKLACLLRAADAAQIDARRAPRFERTILKLKGISDLHWAFQGKLGKPRVEGDGLVFTSGSPFSLDEADAWWLCFDTVQTADLELRDVDSALEDASQCRLRARRVCGVESPQRFSRDVRTEGWDPVDARLRVSDVPRLVQMFGGERLYGGDAKVAIRELLQNGADAIRARRKLDPTFSTKKSGEIVVQVTNSGGHAWLEIQDNGLGMSARTMTGTLLDFGRSFWSTDAVHTEFPGLMAKGMLPTGKFGIGFFSVFMLGDLVRVTSRRYDSAASDTRTLEFRGGLSLRPILRKSLPHEVIHDGGTKVSVLLKKPPYGAGGFLEQDEDASGSTRRDLGKIVAALCPSLDVTVAVTMNGRKSRVIKADDWLGISGSKLLTRINPSVEIRNLSGYARNLRPVRSGRNVFGRACIRPDSRWDASGRITVGGFSAMELEYLDGLFLGTTDVLARNSASLSVPAEALSRWATEQSKIVARSGISEDEKIIAAGVVLACGGDPGKLPLAHMRDRYLNKSQLEDLVRSRSKIAIFEGEPEFDEDMDDCRPREFRESFTHARDVMFLGEVPGIKYEKLWFPEKPMYWSILKSIIRRCWKSYSQETVDQMTVGRVDYDEIHRDVEMVRRER